MTASYGYDVFGEVRTGTPPYYDDAFLFTGEQRDWETGLYYLRARCYEPAIGRFLSQDPPAGRWSCSPVAVRGGTYRRS